MLNNFSILYQILYICVHLHTYAYNLQIYTQTHELTYIVKIVMLYILNIMLYINISY